MYTCCLFIISTKEVTTLTKLTEILEEIQQSYSEDAIPYLVNKASSYLLKAKQHDYEAGKDNVKYVVAMVTDSTKDIVSYNLSHVMSKMMNDATNFYTLYFTADLSVLERIELSVRSKLYNIDSDDVVEAFCNGKEPFVSYKT